jgi:caffeoyl-CoA O-methyltransferase
VKKFISQEIESYALSKSNRPSALCAQLAGHTVETKEMSVMLIGEMEASFLGFLINSISAKRVLEFGTFTGYSALAMAEQLPADGEVVTMDLDQQLEATHKEFWNKSPHGAKIKCLFGPALETVMKTEGLFDLVFIDADKTNYLNYLKISLEKLAPGGIIALDNVLWSGEVLKSASELDPEKDSSTLSIQEVNDWVRDQEGLYGTLVPIRDGIFVITKKG